MKEHQPDLPVGNFHSHPTPSDIELFQSMVLDFYHDYGRDLPWRHTVNPYHILVSEIMLQQTQVQRVLLKYESFIKAVPDFDALARLPFPRLLELWQGLGYNRRALALKEAAVRVVGDHGGVLPDNPDLLKGFKGIGPNTAASVCVFAYNKPLVFIETNIRRVFTHYFFSTGTAVDDRQLLPIIEKALYAFSPRDWYNALMDLGSLIPKHTENPNRRNPAYRTQSPFEGSLRQIRGEILRVLAKNPVFPDELGDKSPLLARTDRKNIKKAVSALESEGFVVKEDGSYRIRDDR
ncbi:MAG: A/G-specific adenine glycosylase [Spirochaetales bacterium]|nr:A/G-specific adenine glycosylase [Spirochaetales bacterium]